jgi:glucokinase
VTKEVAVVGVVHDMNNQHIIGIDLGGTTAKLGLFTQNGTLLEKWGVPTDTSSRGKNILLNLAASIQEQMRLRQLQKNNILGVGLGIPGVVMNKRNVGTSANLNGWGGFDVAEEFARLCGIPVKVINDANAATLGELWQGSAKGAQNMFLVTLGTGVGGGLVINGHIIEGSHGIGGEIGHINVNANETRICGCGNKGCLEQYASATGIANSAKALMDSTDIPSSLRQYDEVTAKHVFEYAQKGDVLAIQLANKFALELGRALSIVSNICDPEVIVIGGGVSAAGLYLLDAVKNVFEQYVLHAARSTVFKLATLGNDAGIYGAARLMME